MCVCSLHFQGSYRAAVPSGASTGIHEAVELRDKGSDYMGKGDFDKIDSYYICPAQHYISLISSFCSDWNWKQFTLSLTFVSFVCL